MRAHRRYSHFPSILYFVFVCASSRCLRDTRSRSTSTRRLALSRPPSYIASTQRRGVWGLTRIITQSVATRHNPSSSVSTRTPVPKTSLTRSVSDRVANHWSGPTIVGDSETRGNLLGVVRHWARVPLTKEADNRARSLSQTALCAAIPCLRA